jgi:BASS family bile acid:Na+ symporter
MHALKAVTTALSVAYLVSMMLSLGLELGGQPEESREQKRAKRRLLVRGLVVNLVVFPAVAYGIVRVLHASGAVADALMLLAVVPGGRFAPHLVKLGGGDVPLAVELTLFLAKLTAFTAAPTARWLLGVHGLDVHELPLIAQLVLLQILPLYGGKWLARHRAALSARIQKVARVIAIATMLAVFATVLLAEDRGLVEILRDRAWLAAALVGIAWPALGWLLGGPGDGPRRALSIGANARELALALVLASLAFPGGEVKTAIFGLWSLYTIATLLLAAGMRAVPKIRARGPGRAASAAARSVPAR